MSTITFGNTSNPSNISQYMDSVFGTSLANYRKALTDNIGATNAFLFTLLKSEQYESADGGLFIQEPLMTALAPTDSYDGYDELSTTPTDGITDAIYEWRQMASPIAYNMKEVIQNQHRIVDIVKSRISQAELGIQEGFAQAWMWGSLANGSGTTLTTPRISTVNGSSGIDPISKFIRVDPTSSTTPNVGNIDQSLSANSFWRNKTKTAAAGDYSTFMNELNNIYNSCALGTGGKPDIILMDQTTYELFCAAYFFKYRQMPGDALDFPFEAKKFKDAKIVMDDKVPDAFTDVVSAATYGTAYVMNSKFFKLRYHPDRDFEMLTDENGKKFAKPINGDSRVGHVAWMGNSTCNNRRKQGIYCKVPRTLTAA